MRKTLISNTWLSLGIAFCLILGTLSCDQKVDQRDTILRRDILYRKGEQEPYSGIIFGKGREGYRLKACTFEKTYENGLQHGVTCYWYENGKLESKENYVKGKIDGFVSRYYPSGRPKERLHFENGMRGGGRGEMFWDRKGRSIKR